MASPPPPPPSAAISSTFCVSLPAAKPRCAFPYTVPFPNKKLPNFAVRGSSTPPEPKPGNNESKAVLDAFFLGKAFAEALTERIESAVGELFSVVGQWQAEQQKQVQEFQEEVVQRAKKAKERAAMEATDDRGPTTLREPSTTMVTPASPTSPTTPTQGE